MHLHPATAHHARAPRGWPLALGAAAALALATLHVQRRIREAQRANPPRGHMVHVLGTTLHCTEHGPADAQPLVLLHGSGLMGREMALSGLVEQAAARYRVIVFDRPGHGHSPLTTAGGACTPERQADLLLAALRRMEVDDPIVLGHSWGATVAMALGLNHPHAVRALVLLGGYWYPSPRADVAWRSVPALPLLGTLLSHTLAPLVARAVWPLVMRRAFAPAAVPAAFAESYPTWLSLRPRQLQASGVEAALMIPAARRLSARYAGLRVPVVIAAGADDHELSTRWHSLRLHKAIPGSMLRIVGGAGHMLHHDAPELVLGFVDEAQELAAASRVVVTTARAERHADGPVPRSAT